MKFGSAVQTQDTHAHTTRIDVRALTALAERVLRVSRTSPRNAHVVSEALVAADIDGLPSHGVVRLSAYADQAKCGKVDGYAVPVVRLVSSSAICVDACAGFAYPAIREGLAAAVECAHATGVAAVSVANSHHCGVAGHHVERVASAGLLALFFGNSPAAIAPWGGARPIFGSNPIALAAPRRNHPPLVIDMSLTRVARGKVKLAQQRHESVPEGWALDARGQPTTNPDDVFAGGSMLPVEGAKGAALALVVEILAAAVTHSHFGFEASSFYTPSGSPPGVGQFFIVIDPVRFAGNGFFQRLEVLLNAITSQSGVRLPGSRRLKVRERNNKQGLAVPKALLDDLHERIVASGSG